MNAHSFYHKTSKTKNSLKVELKTVNLIVRQYLDTGESDRQLFGRLLHHFLHTADRCNRVLQMDRNIFQAMLNIANRAAPITVNWLAHSQNDYDSLCAP